MPNGYAYLIKIAATETSTLTPHTSLKSITVFPNPGSEYLYFHAADNNPRLHASLHNLNGMIVKEIQDMNSKVLDQRGN